MIAATPCIGSPQARDEELESAAREAHCHEFISGLENRHKTTLAKADPGCPAAKQQRIISARAIFERCTYCF